MNRRKPCPTAWYGDCSHVTPSGFLRVRAPEHSCARPAGHKDGVGHMCYCGAKPALDGQEPLWGDAA